MTPETAIKAKVNLKNYDNVKIGQTIETELGDFICISKPNIMQPIDSRRWEFEQTTDAEGEPFMSGPVFTIK